MAIRYIKNLLKVFVYYLFIFDVCRLCFLFYFSHEIMPDGLVNFFHAFWSALHLDTSTACYLLFVPLIILLIENFTQSKLVHFILKGYLFITSILFIILAIVEIAVYREMHVKLYFNLLSHLSHPSELVASVSLGLMITMLFLMAALGAVVMSTINKVFQASKVYAELTVGNILQAGLVFILTAGILVAGCRGGLQPIPINEGESYFSRNQYANDAAVNPLWTMVHSYIENKLVLNGDAYKIMDDDQAQKIVSGLFQTQKDTTIHLFKTAKPNVCFLILESWSADVIASLGGYEGLTPNFEKLIKEGYLFTNIKPVGHVSDQGIPGILSGYPALPIGSAINQPERQIFLPCINNEIQQAGYNSSFYFGGQLIYGNIKTYIYRNEFSKVVEQKDLPTSLPAGRLGINDSLMLNLWMDSISHMPSPFFTCLFTLSTHSPFDIPSAYTIDWGGAENPYLNSVIYADRQLGHFFEEAKKQPWFGNTVFVIVADHSHNVPKNYAYCSPEYYHIPLLIYGGALKDEYKGVKNNKLGSQADIASTILNQLQLPDKRYSWSKNLMNPGTGNFAFYTFDEGFGYVEDSAHVTWNKKFTYLSTNTANTAERKDSLYKKGGAYLQVLMKDFLSNKRDLK